MDCKLFKEIVDIAEPIVTIIAIMVGGVWGYMLFVKNRQKYPKAKISHQIFHERLSNQKVLLRVTIKISNVGNVLLSVISCMTWLQQVIPLQADQLDLINNGKNTDQKGKTEIEWPLIQIKHSKWGKEEFEIEPGEDDYICFDFVIDADIQTIIIYSYLQNIKKRRLDMGWSLNTIYNLKKGNDTKREEVKMKQRETQIPMELAPQREIDKKQQRPKVIPPKPQQRPKVIPPKTNKKSK